MIVEHVERTPVRWKKRRRKVLYFTSEKKKLRLSVRKKNASRKVKNILFNTIEEKFQETRFWYNINNGDRGRGKCKEQRAKSMQTIVFRSQNEDEFKKHNKQKGKSASLSYNLIVYWMKMRQNMIFICKYKLLNGLKWYKCYWSEPCALMHMICGANKITRKLRGEIMCVNAHGSSLKLITSLSYYNMPCAPTHMVFHSNL